MSARIMPQSVEAEEIILGGILLGERQAISDALVALMEVHFYQRRNQIIFKVCAQMFIHGEPVDAVTVTTKMGSLGNLEEVGGAAYLSSLPGKVATSAHAEYFIGILIEKYQLRRIIEIGSSATEAAYVAPDGADGILADVEAQLRILSEEGLKTDSVMKDCHHRLLAKMADMEAGVKVGIETGIPKLDQMIGGWLPGKYILCAAEAECGKTSLLEQSALEMAIAGVPVLIVQKDMAPFDFYTRLACRLAGMNVWQFEQGYAKARHDNLREWTATLQTLPIFIESPTRLSGAQFRGMVRRHKDANGVKIVFLDHLRTLSYQSGKLREGIVENSLQLKQSANESYIPHVVFTHISRDGAKSEEPETYHIKESDQPKDDADTILMLWAKEERPERDPATDQVWRVGLKVAKGRSGPRCKSTLIFNGSKMRFEELP